MRTKVDNFGLLAIVISVISGIWLFGFADDVFSVFENNSDSVSESVFYETSDKQEESHIVKPDTQTNSSLSPQTTVHSPISLDSEKKTEPSEPTPITENKLKQKNEEITRQTESRISTEKRILQLEKQTFILFGEGSGYEGAVHLSKHVRLNFELNPISGTNLEQFDIEKGTINLGGYTFMIEGGTVTLDQDVISLSVEHDDHRDPYLDMTGIVHGSILSGKSLDITFEDQLLGLTKEDQTPVHLNLELTMKIKP